MTATLTSPTARWHATKRWGQSERLSCCLPSLLWWTMHHSPKLHCSTSWWIQVSRGTSIWSDLFTRNDALGVMLVLLALFKFKIMPGILHPRIKIISSFIHPNAIPFFLLWNTKIDFFLKNNPSLSVHLMQVDGPLKIGVLKSTQNEHDGNPYDSGWKISVSWSETIGVCDKNINI